MATGEVPGAFRRRLLLEWAGWQPCTTRASMVDATCEPPQSVTYGGMLAHVTTFSAFRHTVAVLARRELGVNDVGIGDPIEWERGQV